MFATAMVPLAVSMVTTPPALPAVALLLAPVVTRSPARLTVPVPVTLMSMAPEMVPLLTAAVVVMLLVAARSRPPAPALRVTSPPLVTMLSFRSTVAASSVTPPVVVSTPPTWVVPVPLVA